LKLCEYCGKLRAAAWFAFTRWMEPADEDVHVDTAVHVCAGHSIEIP
jgi:hypothetical protein